MEPLGKVSESGFTMLRPDKRYSEMYIKATLGGAQCFMLSFLVDHRHALEESIDRDGSQDVAALAHLVGDIRIEGLHLNRD